MIEPTDAPAGNHSLSAAAGSHPGGQTPTRKRRPGGPGGPPADTPESLAALAREVAARAGTRSLILDRFLAETGVSVRRVYRHYASWRELCRAAGLDAPGAGAKSRLSDDRVLRDLHDAFIAAGGIVNRRKLHRLLNWSPNVANLRWGNWSGTLAAFRDWVAADAPDFPYREELEERVGRMAARRTRRRPPAAPGPPWPSVGGRPAGAPLNYRAMAFAPANELGVVVLFGMVAEALGYAIDTVQPGFPDMTAKRRVSETRWESVRIEVEYRSKSFQRHGHDPAGCDVVVCWQHDWPDCPVEVLCLKDAVKGL